MSAFVVGLLTGVLSGCGIGGGSLLLLWLTLVQDMPQFTAGGINLRFSPSCTLKRLYYWALSRFFERRTPMLHLFAT